MIIYIPQTFLTLFEKEFKKHHISIASFCAKLKKTPPIHIKEPIYKVKFFINGVALRGFIAKKGTDSIVPICVFLKNSRTGENLTLTKEMAKIIDNLLAKYQKDFTDENFQTL